MVQEKERSYIAFISYRHKPLDKQAAEMIQKKIERYVVPKEFREKMGGSRLGMVFRDEDELPASSSLSDSITYALDRSKYLLVICTPDLPESKWCEQEIRYFLKTHDRDHILAVLVSGDPETSFSPYLLHTFDEDGNITGDTEPLAANIAGPNNTIDRKAFNKEIVRIFAALIGCPFDALWQRERRARTNRLLTLSTVIIAVMAVFLGVVLSKNAQIAEQNESLERQMSSMYVDAGRSQFENYNVKGALQSGVDALLGDPNGTLYDHRAEKLLADALYVYRESEEHSSLLYSQPTAIEAITMTQDGAIVAFADETMTVRAIDTASGDLLWEYAAESERDSFDYSPVEVFAYAKCVICKYSDRVIARNPSDGTEIWRYTYHCKEGNHFRAVNSDGSRLMLLDEDETEDRTVFMLVLDTADGSEIGRVPVSSGEDTVSLSAMYPWYSYAGSFSEDSMFGATAIYVTHDKGQGEVSENGTMKFALYDLQSFKEVYHLYVDEELRTTTFNYGIAVLNNKDLFCSRYVAAYGGLVSTLIHGDTGTGTQILTNQSISTESGTLADLYAEYKHVLPMSVNGNLALVASENNLFVYGLKDEIELARDISFAGNALCYGWSDKNAGDVYAWDSSGTAGSYEMYQDGTMEMWSADRYDQSDIRFMCPLYDEKQDLAFTISVLNSSPGNILIMKSTSDTSGEPVENLPDVRDLQYVQVAASPSGDTTYIKGYHDEKVTVIASDSKTKGEIARADFDTEHNYSTIFALDNESFLMGKHICKMDGSSEIYLEKLTDSNQSQFFDAYIQHILLQNGQVMSYYDTCAAGESVLVPVWLDGKFLESSGGIAVGISFVQGKLMAAGRNGLLAGYGIHRYKTEDGSVIVAEKDGFMVFDAINGKRIILDDLHPDARERRVAVGNKQPVFACADDLGNVCLYNADTGAAEDLEIAYTIGDVKGLTFSPDDRYLIIMTRSRKFEIYDLQNRAFVFSEQPQILRSSRYDFAGNLSCTESGDGRYLYMMISDSNKSYGLWISIDSISWTEAASSDLVYAALPDNALYAWRNKQLYRYPIHSLGDLASKARDIINPEYHTQD